MVIKQDARKVLDLMGTKHREVDPDDEFLDRLAKKTSFYDQPSTLPETLNLPPPATAAELDDLADVKIDAGDEDEEAEVVPPAVQVSEPVDAAAAAAAVAKRAELEKKEARFAALFQGRSAGGSVQGGVPDNLSFARLSVNPAQQALPQVGTTALTPEQAEEAAEAAKDEEERRAAWREVNRLREEKGQGSSVYRAAHERFLATWGHRGAELRE